MSKAYKKGICPFCQRNTMLSPHHVFGGTKYMRKFSEKYGAIEWVCWDCHVTGDNSIHGNAKLRNTLKIKHQKRIMKEQGWDLDRWIKEAHESYIGD